MEIIYRKAGELYGAQIPKRVSPDQKVPARLKFDREDLSPEAGYVATPLDRLFWTAVERLDLNFSGAHIDLPRYKPMQSAPTPRLKFEAKDELWPVSHGFAGLPQPYAFHSRTIHAFLGFPFFDDLETGKLTISDIERAVKESPGITGNVEIFAMFAFPMRVSLSANHEYARHRLVVTPHLSRLVNNGIQPNIVHDFDKGDLEAAISTAENIFSDYLARREEHL